MVARVIRPRKPSEALTLALSVIACLAFALSLRDSAGRFSRPAFKVAEPIAISGAAQKASVRVTVLGENTAGISGATVQLFWEHDRRFF